MTTVSRRDLVHDLLLPTLLFAALGAMTWAVRGCSGFGGSAGCIFAGVAWGTAWWFIAREPGGERLRRYDSGWIVLALTVGIGFSGARGWMQWSSFFEGKLQTNYAAGEFVPISRVYGFVWLFIAGMPWAGIGACLLAWCGSVRTTRAWHWAIRIGCGVGGAVLATYLFRMFPQFVLPLYDSLEERYQDFEANPNLRRLINDCRAAIMHLGIYLGLLTYEVGRRDVKNAVLILTVGIVNGAGWALCQNWKWAPGVWESANFNWWRCWESSGGISIGIAYGLAYFFVNRRMSAGELAAFRARRSIAGPNLEWLLVYLGLTLSMGWMLLFEDDIWMLLVEGNVWMLLFEGNVWMRAQVGVLLAFGVVYVAVRYRRYRREAPPETEAYGDPVLERFGLYIGLLFGLGLSLRNGLKGWFNIYRGNEDYWSGVLWQYFGPGILIALVAICAIVLLRPLPRNFRGEIFPHAAWLVGLVLVVENVIAQLVTGPPAQWNEFAFSIYYGLLMAITVVIVIHYSGRTQQRKAQAEAA